MPSIHSLSRLALSALATAQHVLGAGTTHVPRQAQGNSASCPDAQLSCQNSSAVADTCCFNAPGGALLQTQFWDTDPATGPSDSWTIHGLWPDNCDGTYEANCDDARAYTNITDILKSFGKTDLLDYMNTYWTSNSGSAESFWEHEWGKHGTCVSTLEPDCYTSYVPTEEVPDFFSRTVSLFKSLPSYTWLADAGITPSTTTTYTLSAIQSALSAKFGYIPYIGCRSGQLDELWYFYNVRGSLQTGDFVATDSLTKSNCPSTGIKYLPKSSSSAPSSSASSAPGTQPTTSPGTGPFTGSGYLNVYQGATQNGCLISAGTWYTSGTCATFSATASSTTTGGFTLKSSKGPCGILSTGVLSCGSGVAATVFTNEGSGLVYSGSADFSADGTASGSSQVKVFAGKGHPVSLGLQWQGK